VLVDLAVLIRRLHDAAEGWQPASTAVWGRLPAASAPRHCVGDEGVIVAHGDYCPGNVIFDSHRPVAVIDFDLVRPTTRLDDCVNALHWWAPLIDPQDRPVQLRHADIPARVRLFADAYRLSAPDRAALPDAALRRARESLTWAKRSSRVDPLFAQWWEEGWKDEMPRTVAWLEESLGVLSDSLANRTDYAE
jgi:aminoglycoside phosphotransferase (APT) family kinase protein